MGKVNTSGYPQVALHRYATEMDVNTAQFAILVDSWSALASTAAAYIAWRVYKWQRSEDVPVVICEPLTTEDIDAWLSFKITVHNTTTTKWRAEKLIITKPGRAIGFSGRKGPKVRDPYGHQSTDFSSAIEFAKNPFQLGLFVDPIGTPQPGHYEGGDVGREKIHLLRSSLRGKKLRMRLTLVSDDASPKKIVIPISRSINLHVSEDT